MQPAIVHSKTLAALVEVFLPYLLTLLIFVFINDNVYRMNAMTQGSVEGSNRLLIFI